MNFPTREDAAYSAYPCLYAYNHAYSRSAYEQPAEFPPQYYGMPMQMMAPQFAQGPRVPLRSDPPASSTSKDLSSAAQRKKSSQWTETEEKSSSSCSVRTKRSFATKHIIRQNRNPLVSFLQTID